MFYSFRIIPLFISHFLLKNVFTLAVNEAKVGGDGGDTNDVAISMD